MNDRTIDADSLKDREHQLHEKLVEQTYALQRTREQLEAYEAAIQITMAQLQDVRQQLYLMWQQAP